MKKMAYALIVVLLGAAACGGAEGDPNNHDPKAGWVNLDDYNEMKCVGTTMLFENTDRDSISTVANDPRCGGTTTTPSPSPSF